MGQSHVDMHIALLPLSDRYNNKYVVSDQTSRPLNKTDNPQYEMESSDMELLFAVFAFFNDIHDIRDHLEGVCADYRQGNLDVMSAAIPTDIAFNIMKRSSSISWPF